MEIQKQTGIIIQARVGSTRLKNKMIKPFYKGLSILEILIERFKTEVPENIPFIVATTREESDDAITDLVKHHHVPFYRGCENNVLQRFIDAAEIFGFQKIIRICADNPLLDIAGTLKLTDLEASDNWDYLAYRVAENKPSILSHLGFWGEWVTLEALRKVSALTTEKTYHEHVTNYLYLNPQIFKIELHNAPSIIFNRNDIRLTVDRQDDFDLVAEIYGELQSLGVPLTVENVLGVVDAHPDYIKRMSEQIMLNKK